MTGIITATLWLTIGITFYDLEGQNLACGGVYEEGTWVAVPIEWMEDGYVNCGDTMHISFSDGRVVQAPIKDTGCLLHYPIWDTGLPFGADLPIYGRNGQTTATGKIAVQHKNGKWWEVPPTVAWGTRWCSGPLTKIDARRELQFYK